MPRNHVLPGSRRFPLAAALLAAALCFDAPAALAQAVPADLAEFRKTWAAAMQKGDGAAVAALSVLPLQYQGYGAPKTIGRARFVEEVGHWSSLKGCLARKKMEPVKGRSRLGTHTFNCDGHGFFFAKRDGNWRFTGYENTNE